MLYLIIYFEISVYVKGIINKLITVFCILILNFSYGLGTFFALVGLRKVLEKSIYRKIKKK